MLQTDESALNVVARTRVEPESLIEPVRREMVAHDPNVPVIEVKTIRQHLSIMLFPPRMAALLLGLSGLLAVVLATTGLYAVVGYTVSQRTREVGIRMALGAEGKDVLRVVLGQAMAVVGIGMVLGLAASFGVSRLLSSFLVGLTGTDVVTFVAVPTFLGAVALVASFIPARRATRVDPLVALRYD